MGFITASPQDEVFTVFVKRQVLKDGFDYVFTIAFALKPREHFPFLLSFSKQYPNWIRGTFPIVADVTIFEN